MYSPMSALCQEAALGLHSGGVQRTGFTFAADEVYKSFGQKKKRQMFYSSRSDSIFGEKKRNEIGLSMKR